MIELQLPSGFDTLEYSWVKATIGIYTLADYSVARKCQQAFWRHCRGSQLILSIYRVNMIQLLNTMSLCRIIFCSVLFVVLTEMCKTRFDHLTIYHTVRLLVNLWRASTLGHDLKLLIENLSDHRHPWAWSQKIIDGPIIEVWENLQDYILKYLKMENWFIIHKFFRAESSSLQTYWCWGMKNTSLRKWFSSHDQYDEQFRLKPTS
jgi:hypothetical protein